MIFLHKYCITGTISERYAVVSYLFNFENKSDNHSSEELKFDITIDPNAFISKFIADIDGKLFYGTTKEKEIAKTEYCEAKEKDENAILISKPYEDISNLFQIQTNIDSKSKISLEITIEQYLQKKFNFNELNIEILNHFNQHNIKQNYDYIPFNFTISDKRCIYDIEISNEIIIDKNRMDKLNQQCVISGKIMYKISKNVNEIALKYKIKGEQNDFNVLFDKKSKTFCHIISDVISDSKINDNDICEGDNDEIKENVLIPRRVVFVIDKSLSMKGIKWDKTICSTVSAIKQLRTNYDRYCVLFFDGNIELSSSSGMILANNDNKCKSISFVKNRKIGGGTDINRALLTSIEIMKNDIKLLNVEENDCYNFYMNQIVFVTDGAPTRGVVYTNQIILNVQNANILNDIDKYSKKISIYSFGVGRNANDSRWTKDLNHSFLKLLSIHNNAIYKRIKESQCDTQLTDIFNVLSKPILSNIKVKYMSTIKNITSLTSTQFDSLYYGNDIIICGRYHKNEAITATISAITGKQIKKNNKLITKPIQIHKTMKIDFVNAENSNNIERIWAYLKLQQFIKDKLIAIEKNVVDSEGKNDDENVTPIAIDPLSLAMKYKFVTPWTSMIVVAETKQSHKKIKKKKKKKKKQFSTKKRMELHEYATATLGAGNMRCAVRLPKGEDFNEWLAVNTIEFFNEISLLYGLINKYCTKQSCPTMSAGAKYSYLWSDGLKYKTPHKCSAGEYIDLLMSWIENQINDPNIFPSENGVHFPKRFRKIIENILKRLFRVYAHIYFHHIQTMVELDAEAHVNTCFKHFIYFVKEFKLINETELVPLADTIKHMLQKDANKGQKYQSKYNYQ